MEACDASSSSALLSDGVRDSVIAELGLVILQGIHPKLYAPLLTSLFAGLLQALCEMDKLQLQRHLPFFLTASIQRCLRRAE